MSKSVTDGVGKEREREREKDEEICSSNNVERL